MGYFAYLLRDTGVRQPQDHLAGLVPTPKAAPSVPFKLRVDMTGNSNTAGGGPGSSTDDASRNKPQGTLVWEPFGEDLIGGDRVAVASAADFADEVWELAGPPSPKRLLGGTAVVTAQAYRVAELYPDTATIRRLGGAVVRSNVPVGLWQTSPGRADEAAAIYDYDAEAPFEYLDDLTPPNRELVVAGAAYKIVDATRHEQAPRVTIRLRSVRPGG